MRKRSSKHTKLREITCCVCKKAFHDYVSLSELKKNKTCSKVCLSRHMKEIQQKRSYETICLVCGKGFRTPMKNPQIYCSRDCFFKAQIGRKRDKSVGEKISQGRIGKANPSWKGGVHLYSSVHHRLKKGFGVANRCENLECKGKSKNYDWALKRDKEHGFDRNNYYKLCRSCHRLYDYGKLEVVFGSTDNVVDVDDN